MAAVLQTDGLKSSDPIRMYSTNVHTGSRINLGFVGAVGTSKPYVHLKTNVGGSDNLMCKFEYNGYTYSNKNVHNSVTFYTYESQSTPYDPRLRNWGDTSGGIVNYYYSSDDYVVIVVQTSTQYTGGFLYFQSGRSHAKHDVQIVAYTSNSSSSSGVY